jgi:hypothetical protein
VKECFTQSAIIELEGKSRKPGQKRVRAFYFKANK